ncbi:hypothetical protein KA005_34580 [bacterium]|nr:hypothetical protein [bacterium]
MGEFLSLVLNKGKESDSRVLSLISQLFGGVNIKPRGVQVQKEVPILLPSDACHPPLTGSTLLAGGDSDTVQ